LKTNQPKKAKEAVDLVLQVDSNNLKALYNKGMLCIEEKSWDEAADYLEKAHLLDPANVPILRELKTVQLVLHQKEQQLKGMYNRMIGTPKKQSEVVIEELPDDYKEEDSAAEEQAPAQVTQVKDFEKQKTQKNLEKLRSRGQHHSKTELYILIIVATLCVMAIIWAGTRIMMGTSEPMDL